MQIANNWARVEPYPSHDRIYARLVCGRGSKRHICLHIPGGQWDRPLVQARVKQLEKAIARKTPPAELVAMVRSFSPAARGRMRQTG
jgi:hypothetical protein